MIRAVPTGIGAGPAQGPVKGGLRALLPSESSPGLNGVAMPEIDGHIADVLTRKCAGN